MRASPTCRVGVHDHCSVGALLADGKSGGAGPPVRTEDARKRTFKTKDEVERTKGVSSTVVGTLLFISVVVPMLQYYGYTSKE